MARIAAPSINAMAPAVSPDLINISVFPLLKTTGHLSSKRQQREGKDYSDPGLRECVISAPRPRDCWLKRMITIICEPAFVP